MRMVVQGSNRCGDLGVGSHHADGSHTLWSWRMANCDDTVGLLVVFVSTRACHAPLGRVPSRRCHGRGRNAVGFGCVIHCAICSVARLFLKRRLVSAPYIFVNGIDPSPAQSPARQLTYLYYKEYSCTLPFI